MTAGCRWFVFVGLGSGMVAAVLAAAGCDDVSVGRAQPPAVRAAPRPISSPARAEAAKAPARADEEARAAGEWCYRQVVLLSGDARADAPLGLRCVPLERAQAEDVGRLIAWLYPPCGPAGGRTRYCMVYPSEMEAEAAARMAVELDLAPVGGAASRPAGGATGEAWTRGVGLLYAGALSGSATRERIFQAEAALAQALADPALPGIRRWAAGMLAGRLAGERLADPGRAERYYTAAEAHAASGSLEQRATWLARADNHIRKGEPASARRFWGRVLTEGDRFRDTEVYGRAGRALRELDRQS